jgi:hypothetical protein
MSVNHDNLAVVEECVGEGGSDRRKIESVCDGRGRGEEQRAVIPVSLDVEGQVCVDDFGEVIWFPGVIKGL